jgi:hypothetical protein
VDCTFTLAGLRRIGGVNCGASRRCPSLHVPIPVEPSRDVHAKRTQHETCREDAAELATLTDAIEAYEAVRWPNGKIDGGKG